MSTKFGINSQKSLISRSDILSWINELLVVELTRIEELGSGSIYCQIFDVIYPGQVALNKVKWGAKLENEFIQNFRILQSAFDQVKVNKVIPTARLAQLKYQDNLEFAQWLKKFFDQNCKEKGKDYDALERRSFMNPEFGFIKRGAPPKYTLVYSHNAKNAGTCYSIPIEGTSENSNNENDFSSDSIVKKQKLNTQQNSVNNQESECKFFQKKPLENSQQNNFFKNNNNENINNNQVNSKVIPSEDECKLILLKLKETLDNCQGLPSQFVYGKIKDIIFK